MRGVLPFVLIAAFGVGTLPALSGCVSKGIKIPIPDSSADIAEAMKLKDRADRLFKDGKHLEAIEQYKAAIRKNSTYGEAWNNLGLALLRDNNRYDAQQAYIRAGELMPLDPTPMDNLGVLYMESNLPGDAIKYYEMALERRPQYLPSVRGAVRAAQLIDRSEESDLARIKMGLRLETDPTWRIMFQRQLARVEADLEDQARNSPGFARPKPSARAGEMRSEAEANRVEAGVVAPRADE
jgi:tetratricopeptide (TPR) repeat protein